MSDPEAQKLQLEKLAAIGQLVAGFTHEARNPLSVIIGYSQRLQAQLKHDPSALRDLAQIEENAQRLDKLVRNMLSFSRQSKTTIGPIELSALIDSTVELLAYEIRARGLQLVKEYEPDIPLLAGNVNSIRQVFLNLLTNALQAMEDGAGSKIVLRVRASPDQREVIAQVADDGPGIAPDLRDKVFDAFFTTKGEHGTGLGLSIVTEIMARHRGRIALESSPGQGTTFTLTFPAT